MMLHRQNDKQEDGQMDITETYKSRHGRGDKMSISPMFHQLLLGSVLVKAAQRTLMKFTPADKPRYRQVERQLDTMTNRQI